MDFQGRLPKWVTTNMRDAEHRWVVVAVCLVGLLLSWAPKAALAVDCDKPATRVDKAICRDLDVREIDSQLTRGLQQAIAAHPDKQDEILFDQRLWLAELDGRCAPYAPKMQKCLLEVYHARLTGLGQPLSSTPPANPDLAVCNTLLERYRPLAKAHSGEAPAGVLEQSGTTGFKRVRSTQDIHDGAELISWGKRQKPSIAISPEVFASVDEAGAEAGTLQKAPGLPFFVLRRSEGRLFCDSSVFFLVQNGVAVSSEKPFNGADEDCRYPGDLASLDSVPLYVRENDDNRPGMTASLDIAIWRADHFQEACTLSLSYLPKVTATTAIGFTDRCDGGGCDDMQKAAFVLVRKKASGDLSPDDLLEQLTDKQREVYQAEETLLKDVTDTDDDDVALVPYIRLGDVYIVKLADIFNGVADYADQVVKFWRLDGGKLVEAAVFGIGVDKGELDSAVVLAPQ
jgi:uncharacterized protein YecT (DUF1311 family)